MSDAIGPSIGVDETHFKNELAKAREKHRRISASMFGRPSLADHPEVQAARAAMVNVVGEHLTRTGFDTDRFEELRAQQANVLHRLADAQKGNAIKASAAEDERLKVELDARRQARQSLAAQQFLLQKPFDIWVTPAITFNSSSDVPPTSWVKFTFSSENEEGVAEAGISFAWMNASPLAVEIIVDGYFILNGHCECASDGGFFQGDRYSFLGLDAVCYVWGWWAQPPIIVGRAFESRVAQIQTNTGGPRWE